MYNDPWGFPDGSAVKNLPAVQETWVQSLGQEDLLEKELATHSSIFAWKFHRERSLAGYGPWGCKESDMTEHQNVPFQRSKLKTYKHTKMCTHIFLFL